MVNINHKWLKAVLILRVKKLGSFFLVSNLDKFLLFDNFFPDLADFQNLNNFLTFKFPNLDYFLVFNNFLYFLVNLLLSLISPILLAANISSTISTYDDKIVFSINISSTALLLKP